MSIIGSNILAGASGQAGGGGAAGYQIERSLRFNSSDSAYLSRTPASAGNRKTWTWAGWVKRSKLGSTERIFSAGSGTSYTEILFVSDALKINCQNSAISVGQVQTQAVLRDPSAWYHCVISFNAAGTSKIYINGVDQLLTTTVGISNVDHQINNTIAHSIGRFSSGVDYFNGYLADVHFIDGQALDPTSFGEFDDNGVWQPIDASGLTYGTNGFHLPFSDNSTAAALGTDTSGNGNTWTVNNISVTAGSGNDSLVDSPTNGDQTDTGVGGEVVGNYATLNPLSLLGSSQTLANGNLDVSASAQSAKTASSTVGVTSGKWYFEVTLNVSTEILVGVQSALPPLLVLSGRYHSNELLL